ncbi:MAG: tRNA (N6-isopentenyl adenosine(37)-C2)-methylthiotransferase MiaB [Ardenticatenaceae bacterium]|nr:tRNA (N6-isopentenyl adenosine(37)-C2)-methylthiotransferase MiaB [Ardenticatenaceae bacterium]MCB9005050.1 tRNA (N6-isopentenyl adenosine(37)-C2)-methylthiotransferase MiaB [Ardenticatenaceae bacterium]
MSKKYHFWITGCQMNYADARRVATELEKLGYKSTQNSDEADVMILQTCTVRQQSEDKAYGRLHNLKHLKEQRPDLTIAVMGCVVGVRGNEVLEERFPYVDVFMEPSTDGMPLVSHLTQGDVQAFETAVTEQRHAWQDGGVLLPAHQLGKMVSAPVAIVYGCSHACAFCIIPQKRGKERSRPVGEIAAEVRSLATQGVKEVVLLGQIVDRYGYDVDNGPDLADLLRVINEIDGIERVRFLTSHPNYMTDKILYAVRDLPKVMPQIEVPIQAGDDTVLENMKRGYTQQQYRDLVHRIRDIVPDAAIHTDIIVGFPGETEAQFQQTYDVLSNLRLDKIHLARYSPRPGTVSARRMKDDVLDDEKRRRFHLIEALNAEVSQEKMQQWLGQTVEVLVEDKHKGKWRGRTPHNKLVFFEDPRSLRGELVQVHVSHTGAWSMSGTAVDAPQPEEANSIPLTLMS